MNWLSGMPGSPLITLFLATNVMCAITGTATGAAGMVAPILGDIYLKMGIPAATIARTIVVSGGRGSEKILGSRRS